MNDAIDVLLLMAGKGTRTVSIPTPKPFIQFGENRLFELALTSAISTLKNVKIHIAISRENLEFAMKNCIDLPYDSINIFESTTKGPAETARKVETNSKRKLFILDCDLKFHTHNFKWQKNSDCIVFWGESQNPEHSFVKFQKKRVIEIREKDPFTTNGVVGFYGFRNKLLYNQLYDKSTFHDEHYISQVLKTAIDLNVIVSHVKCDTHTPLGTIAEIKKYRND